MRVLGIDLDPVAPSIARADGADGRPAGAPPLADFPLALVKPRVRGTPFALDRRWPARSEGTGLDPGTDPQKERIPLACAWQALARGRVERIDFGDAAVVGRGMAVGEALGFAAGQLAADADAADGPAGTALVVPDAIDEQAQEDLLRGLRHELRRQRRAGGGEALLWRPVAATLAWLARHEARVGWKNAPLLASVGCVLHLHLGLDGFESAYVDLVPFQEDGKPKSLLPGRRRPRPGATLPAQPLAAMQASLEQALAGVVVDPQVRNRMAWHAAWMSPLLRAATNAPDAARDLLATALVPGDRLLGSLRQHALGALERRPGIRLWHEALVGPTETSLLGWPPPRDADDATPILGIVVTGDMADWRMPDGSTLADVVIARAGAPRGAPVARPTPDGASLLAEGAARFAARRQAGEAAYLDSLPQVELICVRDGEPAWIDLLDFGQRWAVGGRETTFEPKGVRFLVRRGQAELRLVVHREHATSCRSVGVALDAKPAKDCPVRLRVAIEPGQGNPRVELVPDDAKLLRGQTLRLDWETATDTGLSKVDQLAEAPRAFPRTLPRAASNQRWRDARFHKWPWTGCEGVRGLVAEFLGHASRWRDLGDLDYLIGHLRRAETNRTPSSAVSSDGKLEHHGSGQNLVEGLVQKGLVLLQNRERKFVLRGLKLLAAVSADHRDLRGFLAAQVEEGREIERELRGPVLLACGSCLRDPQDLDRFFRYFGRHFMNTGARWQLAEALGRIAMHRDDALRHAPTEHVEMWLFWLVECLGTYPIGTRVPLLVARAAEAIAYLLRRRRYDAQCAAIGSRLHLHAKARIAGLLRKPFASDPPSVARALEMLARLADYLDGQGRGDITIDTEGGDGDGGDGDGADGNAPVRLSTVLPDLPAAPGPDDGAPPWDVDGDAPTTTAVPDPAPPAWGSSRSKRAAPPEPVATATLAADADDATPPFEADRAPDDAVATDDAAQEGTPAAAATAAVPHAVEPAEAVATPAQPAAFRGVDPDQQAVAEAAPDVFQLVTAPPGAGKTAVACERIRSLARQGVPPTRILMISFTRAAVAEFRNRMARRAADDPDLLGVEITTLDAQAWRILHGLDDSARTEQLFGSHDDNIAAVVAKLRARDAAVLDWLSGFRHVLVDEAQDLVGARAELVAAVLGVLGDDAGATVFADRAQAIYGWAQDDDGDGTPQASIFERLRDLPRRPVERELRTIHRTANPRLRELFLHARTPILDAKRDPREAHAEVADTIRRLQDGDAGSLDELRPQLAGTSRLVLFRTRAQTLLASSLLLGDGVTHRLRMAGLPHLVEPWLGLLLHDAPGKRLRKADFVARWQARDDHPCLAVRGRTAASAWDSLHAVAGERGDAVDLETLRRKLARSRPPEELTLPEQGFAGPILGTIHASKGREAEDVVLMLPRAPGPKAEPDAVREEARVLYVGATRAASRLLVGDSPLFIASSLRSGRVWRRAGKLWQFELGRDGDVDRIASASKALHGDDVATTRMAQDWLAGHATVATPVEAMLHEGGLGYMLLAQGGGAVGTLGKPLFGDLHAIRALQHRRHGMPNAFKHVWCVGATTVAIAPDDPRIDELHGPWRESGFFLAPVIRALTMV